MGRWLADTVAPTVSPAWTGFICVAFAVGVFTIFLAREQTDAKHRFGWVGPVVAYVVAIVIAIYVLGSCGSR